MNLDFPVIYGSDSLSDLNSLKGDLQESLGAILGKKILNGVFFEATLSTDPLEIPHKLGRLHDGYIVVKARTWDAFNEVFVPDTPFTGHVYEAKSINPDLLISLYSTSDVVVNVWVF